MLRICHSLVTTFCWGMSIHYSTNKILDLLKEGGGGPSLAREWFTYHDDLVNCCSNNLNNRIIQATVELEKQLWRQICSVLQLADASARTKDFSSYWRKCSEAGRNPLAGSREKQIDDGGLWRLIIFKTGLKLTVLLIRNTTETVSELRICCS